MYNEFLILFLILLALACIVFYMHMYKNKTHWVEKDGRIHTDIRALLNETKMVLFIKEIEKSEHAWFNRVDKNRYAPWDNLNEQMMLKRLIGYNYVVHTNQVEWDIERANLSAASFMLDIKIPSKLWLYNRVTLENIAKYEILRGPKRLDAHNEVIQPYVKAIHLLALVDLLFADELFLNTLTKPTFKLSCFGDLWDNYSTQIEYKTLFENEMLIFKKALTIVFHFCDMAIPRDYFYFDEEVKAIVLK